MKKIQIIAVLFLLFGIVANAKPVTRDQAKATAASFLHSRGLELKANANANANATGTRGYQSISRRIHQEW